jgi:7-cyano-7-deazaguanine reductase
LIETLSNRFAGREYEVELADPEFTSICPLTGAPDFGTLTIRYVPGEKLLELRALRDFLAGFRNREILQEEVVNEVLDEIVTSAAPVRAEVEGNFNVRGGLTTRVVARHPSRSSGAPGGDAGEGREA